MLIEHSKGHNGEGNVVKKVQIPSIQWTGYKQLQFSCGDSITNILVKRPPPPKK